MIVVVIVSLLVLIGLAVLLWRAQATIEGLTTQADMLSAELDVADNEITAALARGSRLEKERDDAFERVQRARRDASEVAGRLQDERAAREVAERSVDAAETRVAELEVEVEALTAAAAGGGGGDGFDQLWMLALAASERTWRTSVATGAEASPLAGADDALRTAIEIEVDAAREEAGAAIDLVWELDGEVPVSQAVLALATVQAIIASIAKTASSATVTVAGGDGSVEVSVVAADDDGAPLDVEIAGRAAVAPGRYRVGSV